MHGHENPKDKNQLGAQFFLCIFISILYIFRATMFPSSGENNCINATPGICHSETS
jgi:hypothetical protein